MADRMQRELNGLPQESKLATYMNHSPSTPPNSMSLESSPNTPIKLLVTEFVPMSYYCVANYMPQSPEGSPPPALVELPATSQVHQENVGGTTYFFPTNTEGLRVSRDMNVPVLSNDFITCNGPPSSGTIGVRTSTGAGGPRPSTGVVVGPRATGNVIVGPRTSPAVGPRASATSAGPRASNSGAVGPRPAVSGAVDPGVPGTGAVGTATASPYASHVYSGNTAHSSPGSSHSGLASTFYLPETIRSEIYQRNEDVNFHSDLRQYPELPANVEMFAELTPLEISMPHTMATSYRAYHRQTCELHALRRLLSYSANVPQQRLEMWKQIDHPNIVKLHGWFTTQSFGDHSMVLVYSYHPACTTLMTKYLSGGVRNNPTDANGAFHDPFSSDPDAPRPYTHQKNAMLRAVAAGVLLPEAVLWSLLVQLTAALRVIHASGLACRTLDPTKVVVNGCRVRIAWCGAADALLPSNYDVAQAQQDDLTALGRLALALACRSSYCDNLATSMDLVARTYSADLKNLIMYLLSTSTRRSITDLMPMIGARFYTQVEALERRADVSEDQLAREIDNGRLLRILIKLGLIIERPELNLDTSWSETGDRYMLKLFRDYLFHTVSSDGRPWIDEAHVAYCLNQLDAGTSAMVELTTRDEQSVLVISYEELKHGLEQAFTEVMRSANGP